MKGAVFKKVKRLGQYKYYYFLWRNGIKTNQRDWSKVPQEDFIKNSLHSVIRFRNLQNWEKTPEYQELSQEYMAMHFVLDIQEIYEATKKKALQGDATAVKTLLTLQQQIKKNLKNNIEVQDDGLEL